MTNEAVILDALRTPIGKKDGALAQWRPDDLAGEVMSALVKRNGIDRFDKQRTQSGRGRAG